MPSTELPQLTFRDQAQWRTWLGEHHGLPDGIWMRLTKKSSGIKSISYAQALETALCCGWIDGQDQKLERILDFSVGGIGA